MKNDVTKRLTLCAVLTALALIFSYVEAIIPPFFAIPGIKLGLANLVVVFALYRLGTKEAVFINLVRILLSALLFGNTVGLLYSVAGAVLSLILMILLIRIGRFKNITVSIVGGISHNIGQILVATILIGNNGILWYLTILWISGIVCGALIGLLFGVVDKSIPRSVG